MIERLVLLAKTSGLLWWSTNGALVSAEYIQHRIRCFSPKPPIVNLDHRWIKLQAINGRSVDHSYGLWRSKRMLLKTVWVRLKLSIIDRYRFSLYHNVSSMRVCIPKFNGWQETLDNEVWPKWYYVRRLHESLPNGIPVYNISRSEGGWCSAKINPNWTLSDWRGTW